MENSRHLPQLCNDEECTGCLACVNACSNEALELRTNEEGFYRPLLAPEKCLMCGLCEKSCPVINPPVRFAKEDIKVCAAWHKDDKVRQNSSSGGAFTALAETILDEGGVVAGAAYTSDMCIEHICIDNAEDLERLRLSKYAQSKISNIFAEVKTYLKAGKKVLFVGTACQAAGLKAYLRKDYENLIVADIICHGVPSIDFLQRYLKWIEPKTGKVCAINFRDKRKGWYDNLRVVTSVSGNKKAMKGSDDAYWIAFNRNNCLQECCYNCKAQGFPRCSDITLADFWRIGHKIPFGHKDEIEKGVSMILVNNPRAQKLVEYSSCRMFIEKRTLEESIAGNKAGLGVNKRPASRDTFYKDLNILSFEQFRQKYMKPTRKELFVKLFRERLPYFIIKYIRMNKQK